MEWPVIWLSPNSTGGAMDLIEKLRDLFNIFSIPEVISFNHGPEFTSDEITEFLRGYGIEQMLSSVENLHNNQRAEAGIQTMK